MRSSCVRATLCIVPLFLVWTLSGCTGATSPAPHSPIAIDRAVAALRTANASVQVLPALDGFAATAINDSDEIVGGGGANRPFRWDPKTGLHFLATNGAATAAALAVDNRGAIAGFVQANNTNHAAVWLPNGMLRVLQPPGDSSSNLQSKDCAASGINIYGKVVGQCGLDYVYRKAAIFPWHAPADTSPNALVSDGDLTSVSNDGWIGGQSDQSDIHHSAYLISPTGQLVDLRNHFGAISQLAGVLAVTRHGWAAGFDFEGGGGPCPLAVAWLAAPNQSWPEFRLGTCGRARGITADWYVTGTGTNVAQDDSSQFAFIWFPGPGLQRLPGLGHPGETSGAAAINAKHHVLGQITSGGVTHTVIWTIH